MGLAPPDSRTLRLPTRIIPRTGLNSENGGTSLIPGARMIQQKNNLF